MAEPTDVVAHQRHGENSTAAILDDLMTRMTQVLTQNQVSTYEAPAALIGIKLDSSNYGLLSQVVEMYISGKDKLGYINGDIPQPESSDPTFQKWRTENAIVKGWIINSMDPTLIGNFIHFPTAKFLWDAVATTYFDGTDTSQVYSLKRRVTRMRQAGGSIEEYYNGLQGLWREIDFRRSNPMECPIDIQRYNSALQEDRVYLFLDGLDDRLDKIRADVLQIRPFPTVEQAYAHVRREAIRQSVMKLNTMPTQADAMASKGAKAGPLQPLTLQISKAGSSSTGGGNITTTSRAKTQSEGGCTHCGNMKHTRETCFKLHGYPGVVE